MHSARVKAWLRHYLAVIVFLLLQLCFWQQTKDIKPELGIVPNVPGKPAIQALTFGDKQFFFRVLAFNLQNAGDTFGRFTSLRLYDFNRLYLWFGILDDLDAKSNMIPSMATYYFGQTQNTADVKYIVDYLYTHSTRDVPNKWWWLVQSIYLASHKLNDMDLALKVSAPLVDPKVPAWAQQMAAVVREKRGEFDDALSIMEAIKDNAETITDADLKYMNYFIEERIKRLDEYNKNMSEKKKRQDSK
jgi:hypothetical protein